MNVVERDIDRLAELNAIYSGMDVKMSPKQQKRLYRCLRVHCKRMARLVWDNKNCPECRAWNYAAQLHLRHGANTDCETCKRGFVYEE